jgi:phenylpyruvate tautomerase PptA (4-oxalocrotonate tautomerase family)
MPMLDVYIPDGALTTEVEDRLVARLTDLLLAHEGVKPDNPRARALAWVWVHRPAKVFVAGAPADRPRYKLVPQVPEGQYDDQRRAAMVADATAAVLDAEEQMGRSRDPSMIWIFPTEIPDGTWAGDGQILRLSDIAGRVLRSPEKGQAYAQQRLATRRSQQPAPTAR